MSPTPDAGIDCSTHAGGLRLHRIARRGGRRRLRRNHLSSSTMRASGAAGHPGAFGVQPAMLTQGEQHRSGGAARALPFSFVCFISIYFIIV